jgi:hypothetical protein
MSIPKRGTAPYASIEECPSSSSTSEVLREVVVRVARAAVSNPRTRKVMEVAAKHEAARSAQLARVAELQDRVAEAFARRQGARRNAAQANLLGALALWTVSAVCRGWIADGGGTDVAVTVEQLFASVAEAVGGGAPRGRTAARAGGAGRPGRGR